jgi:tetratricopeptide (TPR) repeat protein
VRTPHITLPLFLALVACSPEKAPGPDKPKEAPRAAKSPEAKDAPRDQDAKEVGEETKESNTRAPKGKKASPKEDKKLSLDDRKTYKKALNEARELQKKKDYAAAVAAFDKALALFPDDPRAMSEKGWAQFFAKDLASAEKNTRDAIGRTTDKNLLGSSYYNLGRIQEERGQTPDAIASYQESLRVRPENKIVKERLATLNAAVTERDPFAGEALLGPFPTLKALCAEYAKGNHDGETVTCEFKDDNTPGEGTGPDEGSRPAITGSSALAAARVFSTPLNPSSEDGWSMESYFHLALQTKDGWFLVKEIEYVYNPGAFGISESFILNKLEFKDIIPGGAQELLVEFAYSRNDSDMGLNEYESGTTTLVMVCGVGASGKPSCTKGFAIAENAERAIISEEEEASGEYTHDGLYKFSWSLGYSFSAAGALELSGTASKEMNPAVTASIGSHPLSFP